MIQELKSQIESIIKSTKPYQKKKKLQVQFQAILDKASSDSELEVSLVAFLNAIEC